MTKQGKLFVISGGDGSGKTVQTEMLGTRMRAKGYPVTDISFPRYDTPIGRVIYDVLHGKYGDTTAIDARTMTHLFAADRLEAAAEIRALLDSGTNVIANRYVADNMAHQGSKIADAHKLGKFIRWEGQLEFVVNDIPQPDVSIILHVPVEVSLALIRKRGLPMDGHETRAHLEMAERAFLELGSYAEFTLIECGTPTNDDILPKEEIHERIWEIVSKSLSA